jgi:hypothetical protein
MNPMEHAFLAQMSQYNCIGCGDYLPDLSTPKETAPTTDLPPTILVERRKHPRTYLQPTQEGTTNEHQMSHMP